MKDLFNEIWSTVSGNKLRTALTGFAVSWGIFLLICLLGAGNGLMNAFMGNSDSFVKNSVQIWGGVTSLPYAGYKQGRWIRLDKGDEAILSGSEFRDNVVDVSPVTSGTTVYLSYGTNTIQSTILGVNPDYGTINKVTMSDGRFINNPDIAKQIALGTGAGLRLDLDGLVIRLDLGVAIHAPYQTYRYTKEGTPDLTRPITNYYNIPSFLDALRLNFGIGYPF